MVEKGGGKSGAVSGFAANVLFLLQVSYFASNDLLQVVELQCAKQVAAFGLAANGFAPNCLNLWGQQKPGHCKCSYTFVAHLLYLSDY